MNKFKRGDKRESDGFMFWQYVVGGKEYWVSPSRYFELKKLDQDRFAKRYAEKSEEIKKKASEYYAQNRESVNSRNKEYYEENRSAIRRSQAEYRKQLKKLASEWLEKNDNDGLIRSLKRGFQREDGMVFWGFKDPYPDGSCRMLWMTREAFDAKRSTEIERLKNRYASKKEEFLEKVKEYQIKNADVIRDRRKTYRSNNAESIKRKKREYGAKNRDKIAAKLRERRSSNPIVRVANSMRRSIRRYLDCGQKGEQSTFSIIGCSQQQLRAHLESKFKPGMTWENYGKHWHIDHIIPLISARTPDEVKRLCRWENLQPLTVFENISKGSKMPFDDAPSVSHTSAGILNC